MNLAEEFVLKYWQDALDSEKESGINALFTLAQAGLETGWKMHPPGFNFFGIKATDKDNKRQLLKTKEHHSTNTVKYSKIYNLTKKGAYYEYVVDAWFRKYDSAKECFTDHFKLFMTKQRYSEAMKVAHDPYKFTQAIKDAGYATDVNYVKKLTSVINTVRKILTNNGFTINF